MAGQRRIDRMLADDYLDDLASATTAEVRAMRDACEEEESGISYARRILQAKLDIIRAEAVQRRDEGDRVASRILDALPDILADDASRPDGPVRLTRFLVPPAVKHHRRAVDAVVSDDVLATLGQRDSAQLAELTEALSERERELSAIRRTLLQRIDTLQAELTRRYKAGLADVGEVLSRP